MSRSQAPASPEGGELCPPQSVTTARVSIPAPPTSPRPLAMIPVSLTVSYPGQCARGHSPQTTAHVWHPHANFPNLIFGVHLLLVI